MGNELIEEEIQRELEEISINPVSTPVYSTINYIDSNIIEQQILSEDIKHIETIEPEIETKTSKLQKISQPKKLKPVLNLPMISLKENTDTFILNDDEDFFSDSIEGSGLNSYVHLKGQFRDHFKISNDEVSFEGEKRKFTLEQTKSFDYEE